MKTLARGKPQYHSLADGFGGKKIRAAHAKEKQQIQQTCHHPNRLNLLNSTMTGGCRSKLLGKFWNSAVKTRPADTVKAVTHPGSRPWPGALPRELPAGAT